MGNFFDSLEEKYAQKTKKPKTKGESTSKSGDRSRRKGAKSAKN